MDSLQPYKDVILEFRRAQTLLEVILESLVHHYNIVVRFRNVAIVISNSYSQSTLQRFLHNNEAVAITPPTSQVEPQITPRTHHHAETRDASNILNESPHRCRQIPSV